ncbi:MAG TPA: MFS transporter [Polyangiaceae bacterium]
MGQHQALTSYQRKLFVFLSVATFFEGYDFFALTQILPNLRAEMRLDPSASGYLVAFINAGTVIAYLLVRRADRWGRRRVLTLTIAGYTLLTVLSGFAPNVLSFALFQLLARIFLIGEWATSMVIAAEEFPAERRGMVLGVIQANGSLGAVFCSGIVPTLLKTAYGWRSVYFVGIVPLLIVAYARRNLKETARFEGSAASERALPLTHIFRTPHKNRMLELAAIWFVTYLCTQNSVTFWKEFALAERGMSDAQVASCISVGAVAALPGVFFAGPLIDRAGRRMGAVIIFGLTAIGVFGAYTLHGTALLTLMLAFGIFGISAVLAVLNAYTTELFPTELRGAAFAWSNNLLGRVGYVLSPLAIGVAAGRWGWGSSLRVTAVFPVLALVLILWLLPETKARELEETARVT